MKTFYKGISLLFVVIIIVSISAISLGEDIPLLPKEKNIVDFHVHVAGLGYGNSGCFVNKEMRDNFRFPLYLKAMGVTEEALAQQGDRVLFSKVSHNIEQSKSISHAVILSMDGVIDKHGVLDKNATQIYVPNTYVFEETSKTDNLLFGASINPNRPNALALLEQVAGQGAVLIKWIPSIMDIDPSDKKFTAFYQKMVELDMPLLTHTGMEKSFSNAKNELADPKRLGLPLSLGVKVIAAHIATTGHSEGEYNFERILPMFAQYPNLCADISSLTQINKLPFMHEVLKQPILKGRLLYGTDWPLQFFPLVSPWYHLDLISLRDAWKISNMDNQWDRDVALKKAMKVDESVFTVGSKLFLK